MDPNAWQCEKKSIDVGLLKNPCLQTSGSSLQGWKAPSILAFQEGFHQKALLKSLKKTSDHGMRKRINN